MSIPLTNSCPLPPSFPHPIDFQVFPAKMAEPVASIVYASTTKCGRDLEELKVLRQLMEEQYRKEFVHAILSGPNSE